MGVNAVNIAGRTVYRIHLLVLTVAVVVAVLPFVGGRFAFLLDFMIGPSWNQIPVRGFGFRTPAYGGSLPLFGLLTALAALVSVSVIQKVVLFGVLFLLAATAYLTMPGSGLSRLYAGIFMLFNPFVYVRHLAGHWVLLWGLAFLPVVLYTVVTYLESGGRRNLFAVVIALTLLGFNSHLLFASGILLVAVVISKTAETNSLEPLRRGLTTGLLALPVNAYWLGPTVFGPDRSLSTISAFDVLTFAPRMDTTSVLFSIATMHGFWRGGYVYAGDLIPAVQLLYIPVLFLAVYGFITKFRDPDRGYVVRAVAVTAVISLVLGAGVQGPAAEFFRWAFEHVPFFAGMRDSQKFVALLVLAYAYLGALGLGELRLRIRKREMGVITLPEFGARQVKLPSGPLERSHLVAAGLVTLAILTPVLYTFPMVTGYAGQVNSQDYPPTWYEAEDYLEAQPGNDAILFLPWHQYMDYSWLESEKQRIATPARAFFSRPVIQGDNIETGPTYTTSTNPVSNYVEYLFGLGPRHEAKSMSNLGELLTHIDVKYVLVTKEADWQTYDAFLANQSDLTLVLENEDFRVYRNERDVNRASANDRIRYIEDFDAFVAESQRVDTTHSVYVVDEERADDTMNLTGVNGETVAITPVHPAKYKVGATDREFIVFGQHLATYSVSWRFDGERPTAQHLGMSPVYRSSSGESELTHVTFYRIYLPSYLVSLVSLLGLGLFVYSRDGRRLDGVRRWVSTLQGGNRP